MRNVHALALLALPVLVSCQGVGTGVELSSSTHHADDPEQFLPLAKIIDSLRSDVQTIHFHVDKSERRFRVYVRDSLLKTYPCVLGEKPLGDKFHQGDRKTPEGTFTFRSKRRHPEWHAFIWVDYPNAESYRRFKERKAQGLIPADKDIGGEIGIHGVPNGMDHWVDSGEDWTWGCIALKNADVDEIYPFIVLDRTTITIDP